MHSETALHIEPDHPAFAGHFPGMPIVPGVVLLDAAVHAALKLLDPSAASAQDPDHGREIQISAAKFLSPVRPGETLAISLDLARPDTVRFEITSGDRKVAVGTIAMPPAP